MKYLYKKNKQKTLRFQFFKYIFWEWSLQFRIKYLAIPDLAIP